MGSVFSSGHRGTISIVLRQVARLIDADPFEKIGHVLSSRGVSCGSPSRTNDSVTRASLLKRLSLIGTNDRKTS